MAGRILRSYDDALKDPLPYHIRRIPGSHYVRDGRLLSECFERNQREMRRARSEGRILSMVPLLIPANISADTPEGTLLHKLLYYRGVGYMANTADRHHDPSITNNVRVTTIPLYRSKASTGTYAGLFLQTTRKVERNEEILCPYNNRMQRHLRQFSKPDP